MQHTQCLDILSSHFLTNTRKSSFKYALDQYMLTQRNTAEVLTDLSGKWKHFILFKVVNLQESQKSYLTAQSVAYLIMERGCFFIEKEIDNISNQRDRGTPAINFNVSNKNIPNAWYKQTNSVKNPFSFIKKNKNKIWK